MNDALIRRPHAIKPARQPRIRMLTDTDWAGRRCVDPEKYRSALSPRLHKICGLGHICNSEWMGGRTGSTTVGARALQIFIGIPHTMCPSDWIFTR